MPPANSRPGSTLPAGRRTPSRRPGEPTVWAGLGRPLQVLAGVILAAGVVVIVNGAQTLIANVVSVLLLFVFATILALVLTPVVDHMQKLRWLRSHRGVCALIVWLVILGAIVGVGVITVPRLVDEAHNLPQLADRVQSELDSRGLHVSLSSLRQGGGGFDLTSAFGIVSSVVGRVADVVLVAVLSVYLLVEGRQIVASLRRLFPAHERAFDFVTVATGSTLGMYVRGQLLMSTLMGTYTAGALSLLGVHYALVIGAAAFILEFVPILGTVISMTLAVGVALLQSPTLGLLTAVVGLVGHSLDAYVVGPRVNGRVVKLHPLVAMAALLVGAQVAGVLGALFSVPVAAIVNIFLGAAYRARRGEEAMSTSGDGDVEVDTLPRLGDEISAVPAAEAPAAKGRHARA